MSRFVGLSRRIHVVSLDTVGPVLIAWLNVCTLCFSSLITNLIIVFAASRMSY